ncbi:hypothetical protein [Castellaniella caeni]|uniref:hypothetical protein n=1 Tax=Castellaniella caeni TaxID=266123 RepID=UPI0008340CB8|nr:hypothetical protein [Castellaniella caeni]
MRTTRLVWVEQIPLVFGLEWLPLLGEPDRIASQARQEGAGHWVLSGNPPAALGLARGLAVRRPCWSAAALWARQHPQGTVACVLALDTHSWHVLASHEGVALARADRGYPDQALATQALETLRLSYPRLRQVCADDDGVPKQLAGLAAGAPPMTRVHRRARWLFVAALALALVAAGAIWLRGWTADRPAADARQQGAWEAALSAALARRPIHGEAGTRALLGAVYRQPARLAGWSLQSLSCQPAPPSTQWHCRSEYRRRDARADNRGLLRGALAGWTVDFPALDIAQVTWRVPVPAQPPDPRRLPRARLAMRDWASALQAVLPAFTTLRLEAARPLTVEAPRDEQGRALPPPATLPALALRALRVEGPLRSGVLLAPLAQSVSWQKLSVSHLPGTRPGLRASRLSFHLEGHVYENHP